MWQLYDMEQAVNPRRVRMFLAEKGIEVERVPVDIVAGENLQPAYLAINPRGVLPALVLEDGRMLDETVAICRYVERLHPEPNLMGRDAFEEATIERWQRIQEFDGMFAIAAAFRNSAPQFAERAAPGAGPATRAIPELAGRGREQAQHWIDRLDARLAESPFVAGDRFTIADITAWCCIGFARWVKVRPEERHEALARWLADVGARASSRA